MSQGIFDYQLVESYSNWMFMIDVLPLLQLLYYLMLALYHCMIYWEGFVQKKRGYCCKETLIKREG